MTRPGAAVASRSTSPSVLIALLSATATIVALQQTLLIPMLPELPGILDTSGDNASWLVTATVLAGAVSIPVLSRLADLYGKERILLLALVASVVGSVIGSFSDAYAGVLVARALQGVGLALIPIGMAIVRDRLPHDRVPIGIAVMSATISVGAALGLVLGGLITAHLDWRAVFWITGGVGAVLIVAVATVLDRPRVVVVGRFDFVGALLLTAGLTALMVALSKAADWGLSSSLTLGFVFGGMVVLGVWARLALRAKYPIVDLRLATRGALLTANLCSLICGFTTFFNMLVTTQFLQHPGLGGDGIGLDAAHAGLWMVPGSLALAVIAPLSARCTRRFGAGATLCLGALVLTVAWAARALVNGQLWQVVVGSVVVGIGTGLTYTSLPALVLQHAPAAQRASANGVNMVLRYAGLSMASATMGAITAGHGVATSEGIFPTPQALELVCLIAAGAALLALLLALRGLRSGRGRERAGAPLEVDVEVVP